MWAFSSCSEQGLLSGCNAQASRCSGFSYFGTWALGAWASVVSAHGLSSCDSQASESMGFYSGSTQAFTVPQHVESSQTRDRSQVPCFGGGLLSTVPQAKSSSLILFMDLCNVTLLEMPSLTALGKPANLATPAALTLPLLFPLLHFLYSSLSCFLIWLLSFCTSHPTG